MKWATENEMVKIATRSLSYIYSPIQTEHRNLNNTVLPFALWSWVNSYLMPCFFFSFFLFIYFSFLRYGLTISPDWPSTHYVYQTDPRLIESIESWDDSCVPPCLTRNLYSLPFFSYARYFSYPSNAAKTPWLRQLLKLWVPRLLNCFN